MNGSFKRRRGSLRMCATVLVLFSAAWRLDGAELTFEDVRSETDPQPFADVVWGGRTWQRIG